VLYLAMVLLSVGAIVVAAIVRRRIEPRFGAWNATLFAGAGYVVAMTVFYVVLPGINEVPQQALNGVANAVTDADVTFPPVVLWNFRVASLGIQLIVWTTIALVFGVLAQRVLEPARSDSAGRSMANSAS
jgi:hypothetical protein